MTERSAICPACRELRAKCTGTKNIIPEKPRIDRPEDHSDHIPIEITATIRERTYSCDCGCSFRTQEIICAPSFNAWIKRKKGASYFFEPFNMNTLLSSLEKATTKAVAAKEIYKISTTTVDFLRSSFFPPIGTKPSLHNAEAKRGLPVYSSKQVGQATLLALLWHGQTVAWQRYSLIFREIPMDAPQTLIAQKLAVHSADDQALLAQVTDAVEKERERRIEKDIRASKNTEDRPRTMRKIVKQSEAVR